MKTKEFPSKPIERIAREASGMRISKPASKALRMLVLESAREKAREAVELSRHAGRRTVMVRDIEFVTKKTEPI